MSKLVVWAAVVGLAVVGVFAHPIVMRRLKPRPRFSYSRGALDPAAYQRLAARPGWASTTLAVGQGAVLRGLIRRPKEPAGARWILFYPGNDFTQLERGQKLLEFVQQTPDDGLLVFADRGFDGSTGEPSAEALAADGIRILDVLLEHEHVDPSRIHVVGFSLGGYAACAAVANAARHGQRVRSLSLLASVTFVEMNASAFSARVSIGDLYDTLPFLPDLPGPVLVEHGTADDSLPIEGSRELARRLGSRATFVAIDGAHHQLPDSTAALEQVRAMIGRSERP